MAVLEENIMWNSAVLIIYVKYKNAQEHKRVDWQLKWKEKASFYHLTLLVDLADFWSAVHIPSNLAMDSTKQSYEFV